MLHIPEDNYIYIKINQHLNTDPVVEHYNSIHIFSFLRLKFFHLIYLI